MSIYRKIKDTGERIVEPVVGRYRELKNEAMRRELRSREENLALSRRLVEIKTEQEKFKRERS
jgi:hypothetical protein